MLGLTQPRSVECTLCPKSCRLAPGQRGDCRVRYNDEGKLYSLVYGKVCAVHVDPVEKKPMFHFLPGTGAFSVATAGCNLHCLFCQNWEISQTDPEVAISCGAVSAGSWDRSLLRERSFLGS